MNGRARGAVFGLLAAASFGASAPLAKLLVPYGSPLALAGLLYAGAALALGGYRLAARRRSEAPLRRADIPALIAISALGGVVGPVLMLIGLARVSAVSGALLLNLEGPLTALVAVTVFREHMGRPAAAATALILAGATVLAAGPGAAGATPAAGVAALAGACLAWAIDNNLTQRLSLRDPAALVQIKTAAAAAGNLVLAALVAPRWPPAAVAGAALAVGAISYGASVVLDAYALRLLGAVREAAYFATAPFAGAIAGALIFRERLTLAQLGSGALMAAGVLLLLRERHAHAHTHEPIEHEHLHVHDEHHQHAHEGGAPVGEPHSHRHRHQAITHAHQHTSDLHHRHRH
jgi:drug/metabolite transporter (DMT)-like permease